MPSPNELLARFRAHFDVWVGDSYNDAFVSRFYDNFFAQSHEIAERFAATNMSMQKTMLHDSLHDLRDFTTDETARRNLQGVAAQHDQAHANIPPRLYDLWLDSLIATLKDFDPDFDQLTERAWREALAPGIALMKGAYKNNGCGVTKMGGAES